MRMPPIWCNLTTGQLPFRGDNTMSILTSLALDTPKPPRQVNLDISPRLAELIDRLLSKDREQRPKTAKAVADELASIEREATPTLVGAASVSAPVASPAPKMLDDYKAYSTRRLKEAGFDLDRRKRWTEGGSTRFLWRIEDVEAAIHYVVDE